MRAERGGPLEESISKVILFLRHTIPELAHVMIHSLQEEEHMK